MPGQAAERRFSMSMSSSLNAGVAGLNANANRLATFSDNIANSATLGFRREGLVFSEYIQSTGEGPSLSMGYGNARVVDLLQAGLDVAAFPTLADVVTGRRAVGSRGPVLFKSCGWGGWTT